MSNTQVYYVWQSAFSRYMMGYAATVSVVLFAIILTIALVQRRLLGWGKEQD